MINLRAMPGHSQVIPHVHNGGGGPGNFPQQQLLSTIYANATDTLHGYDQHQNASFNGAAFQQDPWLIIQKMSEDNRALLEQISRLTTQLAQLQSILYQQQQQNTTHLSAPLDMCNGQSGPVTTTTEAMIVGPKRALSPMDEEMIESNEMDNDPNTSIVSTTQKRRRAVEHVSVAASSVSNNSHAQQSEQYKSTTRNRMNMSSIQRQGIIGNNDGYARMVQQQTLVSEEAKRFAQSRYPFSPFVIIMDQNIRDKIIVEFLCKYVKDNCQVDVEVAGYRRTVEDGTSGNYKTLLFVKNIDTFATLFDQKTWPQEICGQKFKLILPSIPPQLAAVIPDVPMNINMEEFTEEILANYEHIVSVARLRNRFQREIKAVKIEFNSVTARKNMLDKNRILIMGLSLEVVEYLAQAQVLICSQCMNLGHFRKNCPQRNEHTCNTCGDKCIDIKAHKAICSGILKCLHCGGAHKSNDTKCPIVKDYRAALTRSLLVNQVQQDESGRNIVRRDPVNASGSSYRWTTQSSVVPDILESKWQAMADEFMAFKSTTYTVMNEVCDIVTGYGEIMDEVFKGDQLKKFEERTKSIKNLLNALQTQVITSVAS
jgi:hypothetical protein